MELYLTYIVKRMLFPPGSILLLVLLGLLLLRWRPVWGKRALWLGLVLGYLLSTPLVSIQLHQILQTYPALSETQIKQASAQAIVVLSADRYREAPEYAGDTLGDATLVRVRYGAYLQRLTGLPVVVSGGHVINQQGESLAQVMAQSLREDFHVQNVLLEEKSRNTAENAFFTRALLQEMNINSVLLVTHAAHMPRAVAIFEQAGLSVIPAPTRYVQLDETSWPLLLLPDAYSLERSYAALHEMIGLVWYRLRY